MRLDDENFSQEIRLTTFRISSVLTMRLNMDPDYFIKSDGKAENTQYLAQYFKHIISYD